MTENEMLSPCMEVSQEFNADYEYGLTAISLNLLREFPPNQQ